MIKSSSITELYTKFERNVTTQVSLFLPSANVNARELPVNLFVNWYIS